MVSLKQMECVVMVAKMQSFTKAATKLKIAQPSLSQSIHAVEKYFRTPLFNRGTIPITLTHAGEVYVSKANDILRLYKELENQMLDRAGLGKNHLRIGFEQKGCHLIPRAVALLCKKFPQVEVTALEVNSSIELEKMLLEGDLDVAALILPLASPGLDHQIIKSDQIFLALPRTHFRAQQSLSRGDSCPRISLEELREEKFILPSETQRGRIILDEFFKKAGFEPIIFCETETADAATSMVASGTGVYFVIPQWIKGENQEKIVLFELDGVFLQHTITLAYRKDKHLSKMACEFLTIARSL